MFLLEMGGHGECAQAVFVRGRGTILRFCAGGSKGEVRGEVAVRGMDLKAVSDGFVLEKQKEEQITNNKKQREWHQ